MKKILLTLSLVVSSVFFVYAQFQVGGANVNVGRVCGTISGKPACINPSTGQWQFSDGTTAVQGNVNTGQVGAQGSVGGTGFNVSTVLQGLFGGGTPAGTNNIAQGGNPSAMFNQSNPLLGLLALAQTIVARLVPFLIGLAVLAFFWFIVEFIWKGKDSPEEQKKARTGMFWSIVALFVMVSVWGIINFAGTALGIGQGGTMSGFKLPGEQ